MIEPDIVAARPGDVVFVRSLSRRVFARFGDYGRLLPTMMRLPWVRTLVATDGDAAVGFAMISLEDVATGEVDLIAIAVEPAMQSRGVGRALLEFVEAEALVVCGRGPVSLRLTVAEDNAVARGLFERSGYVATPGELGVYDGGQRSIGLRKRLRGSGPR